MVCIQPGCPVLVDVGGHWCFEHLSRCDDPTCEHGAGSSNEPTPGSTASAASSPAGRNADTYLAMLHLACGLITWRAMPSVRKKAAKKASQQA